MKSRQNHFSTLLFNLLYWTAIFTFIFAIRYSTSSELGIHRLEIDIDPWRIYGNGIFMGFLVGIAYTIMEVLLKNIGVYHYSLGKIAIQRTLIQFFVTSAILVLVAYLNYRVDLKTSLLTPESSFVDYFLDGTVLFLLIGALLGNLALTLFRVLQMKIGEHIFYQLLTGKYNPAKEEDRIFLFLDLKSSTTIAEQLGHKEYSYFIQDCFRDLHPVVQASKGQIYQYVGDEAVISWPSEVGLMRNNCLRVLFDFENKLNSRKEYYQARYSTVPVFKGGLSMGKVMVAEVGVVQRDIAYHSDVLNTAARIQSLCNERNAGLLVSKSIIDAMQGNLVNFSVVKKGAVELRGKKDAVDIFELKLTGAPQN